MKYLIAVLWLFISAAAVRADTFIKSSLVTCEDPEYCFPISLAVGYETTHHHKDFLSFFGNQLGGPVTFGSKSNPDAFTFYTDNFNVYINDGTPLDYRNIEELTLDIGIGGHPQDYYSTTWEDGKWSPSVLLMDGFQNLSAMDIDDRYEHGHEHFVTPEPSTLLLVGIGGLLLLWKGR